MARKVLQTLGYVPSLEAGLALTAAVACVFAAMQVAFVAFTRLAAPSRGGAPLFFETLSNAAAAVFVPYLVGFSFFPLLSRAMPAGGGLLDKVAEKLSAGLVEPTVLACGFLAVHCVLKLIAFFAATESRPAPRWSAFTWGAVSVGLALAALAALQQWAGSLDAARQIPLEAARPMAVDGVYAEARSLPLGVDYIVPVEGHTGQRMTLRWALARDYQFPPSQIFITVRIDGGEAYQRAVPIAAQGWTEFRPFTEPLPAAAKVCQISWDFAQPSPWALKWGLRPPPSTRDAVWVAGPTFAAPVNARTSPSIIVIAIDGLSSARLKSQGYAVDTMPVLDNLAKNATFYPTATTPSPEVPAAMMSMLTGRSPLEHGYLGKRKGPLPASIPLLPEQLRLRNYATAAFTEADWRSQPDLGFGSGFERGFDQFDPTTPLAASGRGSLPGSPAPPEHAGSAITLDRAATWAEARAGDRFFMLVRLREAGAPALLGRYGEGFVRNRAKPDPNEVYDTALNAVDKALPSFFDRLKARGLLDSTLVIITSPGGIEVGRVAGVPGGVPLTEQTTMVPLILMEPGRAGTPRNAIVGLEDLAGTLAKWVQPPLDGFGGNDLRSYTAGSEGISVSGDPLQLSLRNRRWRFTWECGLDPFTREAQSGERVLSMINIELSRARGAVVDDLGRQPDEAAHNRARLIQYLDTHLLPEE